MANTNTKYPLSDNQKELLHKIQDFLIEKDCIGTVEWTRPFYKVYQPLKKIVRILHNEYYYERDKKVLNGLRECYTLCINK